MIDKPHDFLMHYGTPRHSGRYPWGSGENPYQHEKGFNGYVNDLKRQGLSEADIAKQLGYKSTTQLRSKMSIEKEQFRASQQAQAARLLAEGNSKSAIAREMHINESQVRNLLKPVEETKKSTNRLVADELYRQLEKTPYLDIGAGVEKQLGISKEKLNTAAHILQEEGKYVIRYLEVEQATNPDKFTSVKILAPADTPYNEIRKNMDLVRSPKGVYFEDGARTMLHIHPPMNIDSKRIQINYAETGGKEKDGVIELRPGVEDLSMGKAQYAQVRIAVDGTHYLKGMAIYNDKLPPGVDIRFNTNKTSDIPMISKDGGQEVLKKLSSDPDNPFGSNIRRQIVKKNDDGTEVLTSACNIVNEDDTWGDWKKNLSSQFLSKQSPALAERQLNLSYAQKMADYETIKNLTNPVIKRQLLQDFADDCDSSAVHLQAAALPRQATHVILPVTSLKDNEIYAPNYRNGEEVVLVRYPHGGTFESPRLIVNNTNKEGREVLGNAQNAVGINHNVAAQMSGADFDGDTVVVIPTRGQKIKTSPILPGLKGFETDMYKNPPDVPKVSEENGFQKQRLMGDISNLITDMTIKGATVDEVTRAVKHSMVIIDAEKHNLNYKQSAIDNNIAELKEKYQGRSNAGAATLISRASSDKRVPQRKDFVYSKNTIDPETGEKKIEETGNTYIRRGKKNKDGTYELLPEEKWKEQPRLTKTTKMADAKDARELLSDDPKPIELKYAEYANKMKALGNEARKEWLATQDIPWNKTATETYSDQVKSINHRLEIAQMNAPKERQAQLIARSIFEAKYADNKNMSHDEQMKIRSQAIAEARARSDASGTKTRIVLTDDEWEAIQAGAISTTKLKQVVRYCNMDELKKRATPREVRGLTPAKLALARSYLEIGYNQADVADRLGISVSTLKRALNSEKGE